MEISAIRSSIDFESVGKQSGYLHVPSSTNQSGWANLMVPIICIANGSGRTVLILGGNHGDEYEGQITALNLAAEISTDEVNGRIIIIPCLSMEASRMGTRLWPDGTNFNRSFPGSSNGSVPEQLAYFLTHDLFPLADVVCDIHSGGRSMLFYPMSHMHIVQDRVQRLAMLEGMLSWNTDFHMLYIDIAGSGLLPSEAERQGKIVVTTELGGGGHLTQRTLCLAHRGLRNMLRHFKVLSGVVETRKSLGLPDATILKATDAADYIPAPESGLYEPLVDPGDTVSAGQAVGRIHFIERPDRVPEVVLSHTEGVVCAIRAISATRQGDVVTTVGRRCDEKDLD